MPKPQINYLNFSDKLNYLKKETEIEEVACFFKYMQNFQKNLFLFRDFTFFIIDYSRRSHVLMSGPVKEISGYHPNDFLDSGLDFAVDIFQKDDFKLWNTEIFPSTFDFLQQQPHSDHVNYVFEFSYRMRNKRGNFFTALQKGSYITDPKTNFPLYAFGIVFDITPIKKDTSMFRIISRYNPDSTENYHQQISSDYYYPEPEEALLTKREKEILKWMADGWSSKQLADKFNLSNNTIMNHRKNMLRKTNAKNVAELIKYAIINHLI
jgi:DNA-binding CsgD family transcriptional regulator